MTNEQIIIEVKKRKFLFVGSILLFFIAGMVFQSKFTNRYKSYTNLIVNEADLSQFNLPDNDKYESFYTSSSIVNRVVLLAYSSKMLDHLIKKFSLYTYYQINPKEQFAYAKLIENLSNRIEIKKTDFNMIKLTISDKDRYQAAAIANEMASKLNEINNDFIVRQVTKKLLVYESLYLDLKNETKEQKDTLQAIVESMKGIILSMEKNKMNVEELKNAITGLSTTYKSKTEEMMKMKQFYLIVLQTLKNENLETITIVNRALPDFHQDLGVRLFYSFLFSILGGCFLITMIYIFVQNEKFIRLIFGK